MYKATKILSLPIRDIKEGEWQGQARNILFGAKKGQYFLELDKKCLGQAEVLASEDIAGIGCDYILIEKKSDIKKVLSADEALRSSLKRSYVLLGVEVVDAGGLYLGKIVDFTIDEVGVVSNIMLASGTTIEKDEIISICNEVVFVRVKEEIKDEAKGDDEVSKVSDDNVDDLDELEQVSDDENQESPVGLIVSEDIVSADGLFEIKRGSVITEAIFDNAVEHDAVLALGLAAR